MQAIKRVLKRAIVFSGGLGIRARLGAPAVAILRYHSVQDDPRECADSIGSGIIHSRQCFAEQMAYIARTCKALSMDEVLAFTRGEVRGRRRAVAVSFDDGFDDNLEVAAPILERCGVPGTVYVAVDYVNAVPWYCSLRYMFARTKEREFRSPFTGARVALGTAEERRQGFLGCSRVCAALPRREIGAAIAELVRLLDCELQPSRRIMLDWEGVRALLRRGHTVGSHSLSHPNLAHVGMEEASRQLVESGRILRQQTGDRIAHFSYPSPILEPHWNEATVAASAEADYETAVTCTPGTAGRGMQALCLPRLSAPQSQSEFVWKLESAFAGMHA